MANTDAKPARRSLFKDPDTRYPVWRFGSREIGFAAAFGGLGFALRAAGVIIPVFATINIDPRDLAALIGPALGGPIAGIIIGVLCGAASALPVVDVTADVLLGFAQGLVFRYLRHPFYYLGLAFNQFVLWPLSYAILLGPVLGVMPFKAAIVVVELINLVYFPIAIFLIELLRKYNPTMRKLLE